MKYEMISDNYFTTKLNFVVNKSFELKTLYGDIFILDKNISLKLVVDNFNGKNDTEQYIINTFKYHVNKIIRPIFENQIFLGEFIYGISISVINALMTGDYYSRYFFKRVPNLLYDNLNFETNKVLTTIDYNRLKILLEEYFVTKPTTRFVNVESLTIEPEVLEMHKMIYLNALSLAFVNSAETTKFCMTLELNIVKCYEHELFNKTQKIIIESDSMNISNEIDDEDFEDYYQSDSYEFDSATNSPYYNDDLDMDQQSPEFWDNL